MFKILNFFEIPKIHSKKKKNNKNMVRAQDIKKNCTVAEHMIFSLNDMTCLNEKG